MKFETWNIKTFTQIRNSCGGLEDVSKATWKKPDFIEERFKVKQNYAKFIPAEINITDEKLTFLLYKL